MTFRNLLAGTGLTLVLACIGAAGGANASVSIGLQQVGVDGGAITTVATGATTAGAVGLTYGSFNANSVIAQAAPLPDILDSTSLDQMNAHGPGTINVFVTEQGLTNPLGTLGFDSGFTVNELPKNGWTVTERSFLDSANGLFTTVTPLGSQAFTSIGTNVQLKAASTGAGPYSLTEEYTIVATGRGLPL